MCNNENYGKLSTYMEKLTYLHYMYNNYCTCENLKFNKSYCLKKNKKKECSDRQRRGVLEGQQILIGLKVVL